MAKRAIKSNIIAEATTNNTILGTFTGKCCDAAVVNNNDMKLDRELFEKLIKSEEYKDAMEHRYYIGFLGHPEDPNCQDFKDGCIVMTSMEIKDNDEIYGTSAAEDFEYEKEIIEDELHRLQWLKAIALKGCDKKEEALSVLNDLRKIKGEYQLKADSLYKELKNEK